MNTATKAIKNSLMMVEINLLANNKTTKAKTNNTIVKTSMITLKTLRLYIIYYL